MSEIQPSLREELRATVRTILSLLAVLWIVEMLNLLTGHRLSGLGIRPRTASGLVGIPLAPLLHHGVGHLLANTVPLLILGWLVIGHGLRTFVRVSLWVTLWGGAGVWLLGRRAVHAGASGLAFGYFGYLVALGWYRRSLASVFTAVVAVLLYGGLVWGVLPTRSFVSWEGHLFGLLAGVWAARLEGRGGTG